MRVNKFTKFMQPWLFKIIVFNCTFGHKDPQYSHIGKAVEDKKIITFMRLYLLVKEGLGIAEKGIKPRE